MYSLGSFIPVSNLLQAQLTVADVAVWSTLYPVFTGKSKLAGRLFI